MNGEPFVDLKAASAFLGVKPSWTYEQVRLGRLPSYKVGKFRRFRISELDAWMRSRRDGNGHGEALSANQPGNGNPR